MMKHYEIVDKLIERDYNYEDDPHLKELYLQNLDLSAIGGLDEAYEFLNILANQYRLPKLFVQKILQMIVAEDGEWWQRQLDIKI